MRTGPVRRALFLRPVPVRSYPDPGSHCHRPLRPRRCLLRRARSPAQPVARTAPAPPPAPSETAAPLSSPTAGTPLRPQPRPNLAGQPAARPVVPPRPDMWRACSSNRPGPRPVKYNSRPRGLACPRAARRPSPANPFIAAPFVPASRVMRGPGVGGGPGPVRRPRSVPAAPHLASYLAAARRASHANAHRATAPASSQTGGTRSPSRCGAGRGPAANAVAPREQAFGRRPSIAKSPSPKASPSRSFPKSSASKPTW